MARSLSDLPPRQQWIVAGVLCFALVAIYYVQFWRAGYGDVHRIGGEITKLREDVKQMEAIADSLPALEAEQVTLDQRLQVLSHILPEEYETADLLRGVATLAAQSNLTINGLEFKDPVPYEFYAESPIELELVGSYHDLARFFDRIGKFARIININEVDIQAIEDDPKRTVEADVTAMTFLFLEEFEQEVAASDGELSKQ